VPRLRAETNRLQAWDNTDRRGNVIMTMAVGRHRPPTQQVPKAPSGIEGLDLVLQGGLPRGRTTLVSGGPGAGKSVLSLEFLYRGALAGEPGILVAFEESPDSIRQNARALGWDLPKLERAGKLAIIHGAVPLDTVVDGEFSISGLMAIVGGKAQEIGAQRIAFDAIDALLRHFDDPARENSELAQLQHWLQHHSLTGLLIEDAPSVRSVPGENNVR
jgi:circadian clock protein KaiC